MMKVLFDGSAITTQCTKNMGIYCWVNTVNGKKYIGLAGGKKGLLGRITNEVTKLKQGSHHNTRLLFEAVKKYGLASFVVYLLFETDDSSILGKVEQDFIRMYGTITPNGYNITSGGAGTIGFTSKEGSTKRRGRKNEANAVHRAKTYTLVSPNNEITSVTNLSSFCKAYSLSESAIRHLVADRTVEHKGWRNAHSTKEMYAKKLSKVSFFVSPSGQLVKVFNIKRFAQHLNVSQASLNHVANSKPSYNACCGWRKACDAEAASYDEKKDLFWNFDKWEMKHDF